MVLRRLNVLHWSISTKLTVIFLVAILVPALSILVPMTVSRRYAAIRDEHEARLEMLGPLETTRTEQDMRTLVSEVERLISNPIDQQNILEYLYVAPTGLSDELKAGRRQIAESTFRHYLDTLYSLSRVRLLTRGGDAVMDVSKVGGVVRFSSETPDRAKTPADDLIAADVLETWDTLTDIYQDTAGDPSVDVVFALEADWNVTGTGYRVGYLVFTQDLVLATDDVYLPDLFSSLADFPQSDLDMHVYLLTAAGLLASPAHDQDYFVDASDSEGFLLAQRGQTGVSRYDSTLLDREVLGFYTFAAVPKGPQFAILAETPMNQINNKALEEGVFLVLAIGFGVAVLALATAFVARLVIARPLIRLTESARQISAGQLDIELPQMVRQDEIGVLNNAFGAMSGQLLNAISELEDRVEQRTHNLATTLEVSRILTRIHDLDTLLEEVVDLIRVRFDMIYHAQVFLTDEQTGRANLRASTGVTGQQLLRRGHYLEIGSQSVIGSVTASGHAVVALDTSENPIHRRNEFLPDTRAEMALPLRSGNRIIGALDLQSRDPNAFDDRDVELFQGMADQISIAIENAALFAESTARMADIENLNRMLTQSAWQDIVRLKGPETLQAAVGQAVSEEDGWSELQVDAMRARQITERFDGDIVVFAVPILLRDEVLGAIEWQIPRGRYTRNVRQTALELTARLALTADNIRLLEQSQRVAQREVLVNQISSKFLAMTDVDHILRTAVRELGLALRVPTTSIRLISPDEKTPEPPANRTDE
ncbi:MAG: GAF domain-containing protein [Anaerolineae bacterium]|nr:GAF domain-containing protein [Anaerolineae bacterium]